MHLGCHQVNDQTGGRPLALPENHGKWLKCLEMGHLRESLESFLLTVGTRPTSTWLLTLRFYIKAADAAFAQPEVYEALEERGVKYAMRIPANDSLERDIAELLLRPVGRPRQKPLVEYNGFLYRAASWKTARRVVAKVEHHAGELFPRVGFIVTNLTLPSRAVVRFYNLTGQNEGACSPMACS